MGMRACNHNIITSFDFKNRTGFKPKRRVLYCGCVQALIMSMTATTLLLPDLSMMKCQNTRQTQVTRPRQVNQDDQD